MPLRLIDTDIEIPVEISGSKLIVKPLTQGNKIRLALVHDRIADHLREHARFTDGKFSGMDYWISAEDENEFDTLIANQILRIDDETYKDWENQKIVKAMEFMDKVALATELLSISSINEGERKN